MSNRVKLKRSGGKMSTSDRMETKPCVNCGDQFALDTRRFATAVHDCETGEWYGMPHKVYKAIERAGFDPDRIEDALREDGLLP